jgi:hypothetical protein
MEALRCGEVGLGFDHEARGDPRGFFPAEFVLNYLE